MINLNDLITDIHASEVVELDESLDAAQQWRIEERIMQVINESSDEDANPPIRYYKKCRKKRWLVFSLAAILLLALVLTGIAAVQNDWDVALIDFMGINDVDTLQLKGREVEIYKITAYKKTSPYIKNIENLGLVDTPIQMTVTTSIGDKYSAYIRIETDYILPETFNPETDYILLDNIKTDIDPMLDGYGQIAKN